MARDMTTILGKVAQVKKRPSLAIIGGTLLGIVTLAAVKYWQFSAAMAEMANQQMPPEAVTSALATQEVWPRIAHAVGSVAPVRGAMLRAEERGRIAAVHFESGATVSAGQELVSFDVGVEEAALAQARALHTLALSTVKRQRALREKNANSQADLDEAEANANNTAADVKRLAALIDRKKIHAPFTGVAGIRAVEVGDLVEPGDEIVAVHNYDEVYVDFALPQRVLGSIAKGEKVTFRVDAFPDQTFSAVLTAIDSQVNAQTRTIALQATAANSEHLLRPGMFASIALTFPKSDTVIVIPASSVSYAPYGNTVYVIAPSDPAVPQAPRAIRQQVVTLGERRGDRIVVTTGIKVGEEVVSSGAFKLRPGVQVMVNNSVQPGNELHPTPQDT